MSCSVNSPCGGQIYADISFNRQAEYYRSLSRRLHCINQHSFMIQVEAPLARVEAEAKQNDIPSVVCSYCSKMIWKMNNTRQTMHLDCVNDKHKERDRNGRSHH